jgi:hypothetical protein
MTQEECYRILGLTPGADTGEIKRAYRRQAKLYHPDVNKAPEAQSLFVKINEAYEVLAYGQHYPARAVYRTPAYDFYYTPETRQEKAARYARMRYEEFKKNNEEFKNSFIYLPIKIIAYGLLLFGALLGTGFIFMPVIVLMYNRPMGLSMLPVSLLGFTIFFGVYRFKQEMNRYL